MEVCEIRNQEVTWKICIMSWRGKEAVVAWKKKRDPPAGEGKILQKIGGLGKKEATLGKDGTRQFRTIFFRLRLR